MLRQLSSIWPKPKTLLTCCATRQLLIEVQNDDTEKLIDQHAADLGDDYPAIAARLNAPTSAPNPITEPAQVAAPPTLKNLRQLIPVAGQPPSTTRRDCRRTFATPSIRTIQSTCK